jgi:hypothetical protein
MRYYPRNEAESNELEAFFLQVARKNGLNLRLHNSSRGFVLRWQGEAQERDDTWMEVDINSSPKAVRLDAWCGARELHEILQKRRVAHEYHEDGRKQELGMSVPVAMKHLEAAFDAIDRRHEDSWRKRNLELSGGDKGRGDSHSRS